MTSKLHKTPAHKQMAAIISNQHPSNINITWFYKISLVRPAQGLVYGICVCVSAWYVCVSWCQHLHERKMEYDICK